MSVKITGMAKLEQQLSAKYGDAVMRVRTDKALKDGADVFLKELKSQFDPWKVDGDSIKEMTLSEPHTVDGQRVITVKWVGPKNRYAIIHLNEFGTIHAPSPPGKGSIARALEASKGAYRRAIKKSLEGSE